MSDSNQQGPAFDSRFILTVILIGFVWMGWQSYLAKKYPAPKSKGPIVKESNQAAEPKQTAGQSKELAATNTKTVKGAVVVPEKTLKYANATWSFVLSSKGMAIRDIRLNKYSNRQNKQIRFAHGHKLALFSTGLIGQGKPLTFDIHQDGPNTFVGNAQVGAMSIRKQIVVNSNRYTFKTNIQVTNIDPSFKGLFTQIADKIPPAVSGFFAGRFDHEELFVNHSDKISRTIVKPDKYLNSSYNEALVTGYGSQYFAVAVLDQSPVRPSLQFWTDPKKDGSENEPKAVATLRYERLNQNSQFNVSFTGFAGPKRYNLLKSIAPEMTGLINFGFFTMIAKWLFWLMMMIHGVVGNWGWVIIVLTLLVRLIAAPFSILSYKQMKAMARIQPQIKALRERYKDDAKTMNQEMMKLMRENHANPVGGCLPMFLQIPIFFALYEVLGQSIELYKAPFIFWIHDLSTKDPYYVLPILMGVAMWAQQKITPSTMDPSQQKILQFMPFIFMAMTVSLPSGLTLYIFVSSLFGFLQQYLFMREKKQLSVAHA